MAKPQQGDSSSPAVPLHARSQHGGIRVFDRAADLAIEYDKSGVALDWKDKTFMQITLYVVTYQVKNAPVSYSFIPLPTHQKRTYTRDGKVYDSVSSEMKVTVPDGSVIDSDGKLLCWDGEKGKVKSTVNEVYQLVQDRASGFGPAS